MPLPTHWYDLTTLEIINEAAQICYAELPDKEELAELPEGADFWSIEDPLDYMWSADSALRMLTNLPHSRPELQPLLDSASVKYQDGDGEVWFCKTWRFPDGTELEMIVPRQSGPIGYCTGYYPENIVATHERF